jgi:hypothetical protein
MTEIPPFVKYGCNINGVAGLREVSVAAASEAGRNRDQKNKNQAGQRAEGMLVHRMLLSTPAPS